MDLEGLGLSCVCGSPDRPIARSARPSPVHSLTFACAQSNAPPSLPLLPRPNRAQNLVCTPPRLIVRFYGVSGVHIHRCESTGVCLRSGCAVFWVTAGVSADTIAPRGGRAGVWVALAHICAVEWVGNAWLAVLWPPLPPVWLRAAGFLPLVSAVAWGRA